MHRRWELLLVALVGVALLRVRPPWTASPEDQVVAACWLAALALWTWLIVVGSIHAWATRTGRVRWRRVTGGLLPAGVRRRVEHLAVAGLLVVPVAACSTDAEAPAAPVLVLEETAPIGPVPHPLPTTTVRAAPEAAPATGDPSSTATPTAPDSSGHGTSSSVAAAWSEALDTATTTTVDAPPVTGPTTTPTLPLGPAPTDAPPSQAAESPDPDRADPHPDPAFVVPVEPGTRVVFRGDSLWSIAVEQVTTALGRPATTQEVAEYWTELVAENRPTLASGNPDVIFAGEVLRLPPIA